MKQAGPVTLYPVGDHPGRKSAQKKSARLPRDGSKTRDGRARTRFRTACKTLLSRQPNGGGFGRLSSMKKLLALAASAAILAVVSAPSRADPVDMSTITCANLMQMKQDEISFVLVWVAGYMAGTEEELSMDPDALGKSVTNTVT